MAALRYFREQVFPVLFGIACLLALLVVVEWLIKAGLLNPFIVPYPSEIALSFERIIVEEDVLARFAAVLYFIPKLANPLIKTVIGWLRKLG
jgi:ABC-type nitrate/sulfonate/bicarbonate transport system permease component